MSKNYSEQELRNVIGDNIQYIADDVQNVTVDDVKNYFAVNAENQNADVSEISDICVWHEIANDDAQIARVLADVKDCK